MKQERARGCRSDDESHSLRAARVNGFICIHLAVLLLKYTTLDKKKKRKEKKIIIECEQMTAASKQAVLSSVKFRGMTWQNVRVIVERKEIKKKMLKNTLVRQHNRCGFNSWGVSVIRLKWLFAKSKVKPSL